MNEIHNTMWSFQFKMHSQQNATTDGDIYIERERPHIKVPGGWEGAGSQTIWAMTQKGSQQLE